MICTRVVVVAFFNAVRPSPKAGAIVRVRIDELSVPTEEGTSTQLDSGEDTDPEDEGDSDGASDIKSEDEGEGESDGESDGESEGDPDGDPDGDSDEESDGEGEGDCASVATCSFKSKKTLSNPRCKQFPTFQ